MGLGIARTKAIREALTLRTALRAPKVCPVVNIDRPRCEQLLLGEDGTTNARRNAEREGKGRDHKRQSMVQQSQQGSANCCFRGGQKGQRPKCLAAGGQDQQAAEGGGG